MGHRDSQDHGWVSGSATIPDFGRVGRWVVTVAGRVIVPTRQKNATLYYSTLSVGVYPPRRGRRRRPVHSYIKTRACTAGVQVVTWVSYARTRSKIRKLAGNRQNNRQRAYAPSVLLLFRTNTASAKPNTSKPRFAGKVI